MKSRFYSILIALLVMACSPKKPEIKSPVLISYTVHSTIPHSVNSFTEGFVIHKGELYESTGEFGKSWIGTVRVKTGELDKKITLSNKFFGEGITILNNKIYQLTWREHTGFVYDLNSYEELRQFTYKTEGWGLTHNEKNLIMSDGTSQLHFLDTTDFSVIKTLSVTYNDAPLNNLNELEYVDGFIYANIWQTEMIARIDATTGEATGFLDLTSLGRQARLLNPKIDLLNGIAWHSSTQSLLVTGKYWPLIYVLKLKE